MSHRYQRGITATTLFVIVAVMQTYVGVSFAARTSTIDAAPVAMQEVGGILTTNGNQPITVNGASAVTGATILSGATIETPDGVSATISIPGHGTVQIPPNSKFTITFDQNGIKVNLIQGCIVLLTKKGTSGEIANAQGVVGKTDGANDGRLDACPGKVAGGGLPSGAIAAIVVGGIGAAVGIGLGLRGDDPSPGSP